MAKGIEDLGSGIGWLYKVKPDKTTIVQAIANDPSNSLDLKVDGVKSAAVASNRRAVGSVTMLTVTGVGSISDIKINGVDILSGAIAYTGATSVSDLATLIYNSINGATSSPNYTASINGSRVEIIASASTGSGVNGFSVIVNDTGNVTHSSIAMDGGSSYSGIIDEAYGWTFFINADYGASGCVEEDSATPESLTNAIEITEFIVQRGLQGAISSKDVSIVSGGVTLARDTQETLLTIDTESAAAADDLDFITADGFAEGDRIIIKGADSGRVVTLNDGVSNIELTSGVSFSTGDGAVAIELQLKDGVWYEVSRSTQSVGSISGFRSAGFGIFGVESYATQAIGSGGTVQWDSSVDSKTQKLTGTSVLASNQIYTDSEVPAVAGDEIWIEVDAQVTVGVFSLSIYGKVIPDDLAANGGYVVYSRYTGVSGDWQTKIYPNLGFGTYDYKVYTSLINDGAVTSDKLSSGLKTELITRRVSFEAGEECDNQIKMAYPGSVVDIYFTVDKVISGTDNGTITPKNNAGTAMTGGLITVTSASVLDTGFTTAATISANNTFIKGDILNFTTAKTTKGGFGTLSIEVLKS